MRTRKKESASLAIRGYVDPYTARVHRADFYSRVEFSRFARSNSNRIKTRFMRIARFTLWNFLGASYSFPFAPPRAISISSRDEIPGCDRCVKCFRSKRRATVVNLFPSPPPRNDRQFADPVADEKWEKFSFGAESRSFRRVVTSRATSFSLLGSDRNLIDFTFPLKS